MGHFLEVKQQEEWIRIRQCYFIRHYFALAFLRFLRRAVSVTECTLVMDL